MRRQARLDASGTLHHVTVRRLERDAVPQEVVLTGCPPWVILCGA